MENTLDSVIIILLHLFFFRSYDIIPLFIVLNYVVEVLVKYKVSMWLGLFLLTNFPGNTFILHSRIPLIYLQCTTIEHH